MLLPQWVYAHLSPDAHTLIQQAELVAAVGVYRSVPALLRGAPVIHFIDNTGSLSNLVHGYASRADCGRLTNAFHLSVARLRCSVWLDWVPSKANVADLPSREDGDAALMDALEGAGLAGAFDEVEFLLPPMQSWSAPLAEFAGW